MFDDNNQGQDAQDNQNPVPSTAPATPAASANTGFSGNTIDNTPGSMAPITPLTTADDSNPALPPSDSSTTPGGQPPLRDEPLTSSDSGSSMPEPTAGDAVGPPPALPEPINDTPADAPVNSDADAPANETSTDDDTPASGEPNFDLPELPAEGSDDDDPTDDSADSSPDSSDNNVEDDESSSSSSGNSPDLNEIKQQALQQLSPLVSHLDQTPEEKFHTTMMMIQATDDESLIPDAYQTAQKITDEKAKAQALLELVNEVNYFLHREKDNNNSNS